MKTSHLFLSFILLLAASLQGQTLDQSFVPSGGANSTFHAIGPFGSAGNTARYAQTVTVGKLGRLSRVEVRVSAVFNGHPLTMEIRRTIGGTPDGTPAGLLHTQAITSGTASFPAGPYVWLPFDLDPGISSSLTFEPGDRFAIVLRSDTSAVHWDGEFSTSGYPSGTAYYQGWLSTGVPGTAWIPNPTAQPIDAAFKTFMVSTPVNEATPYSEGFEVDDGNWTSAGSWAIANSGGAVNGGRHQSVTGTSGTVVRTLVSPPFDFSSIGDNPVLKFQYQIDTFLTPPAEISLLLDLNDGNGFVPLSSWQSPLPTPWNPATFTLTDVIGRVNVRIAFRATLTSNNISGINFFSTAKIDEITIEANTRTITSSQPYFEDFESGQTWASAGTGFEFGSPAQSVISAARSGSHAWMTSLASNYAPSTVHELTSPKFEFPSATGTPVFEYHVHADLASGESFFVEMDLGDGAGFMMLPDSLLNMSTSGWLRYRRAIPSAVGWPGVQFRFVMTSDSSDEAEGVAIDDVSIRMEEYLGSESIAGDDLNMEVFLDGQLALGYDSAETIQPGETVTVITKSPNSLLIGGDYYLVSEAFFGSPNFAQAAPDIWFSLGTTTFLLDGGAEFPINIQVILPAFGALHSYSYPGGIAGLNLMIQAVVVKPGSVQSGFYASSDALLLSFN